MNNIGIPTKIMLWVLAVAGLLFLHFIFVGEGWPAETLVTSVEIHNSTNKYTRFDFVRFDHGIPGQIGPATQYGGGAEPKETMLSENREPGMYGIRFWRYIPHEQPAKKDFDFRSIFFIRPGVKKITIKLDPTNSTPIQFGCDCKIKFLEPMGGNPTYEFAPNDKV